MSGMKLRAQRPAPETREIERIHSLTAWARTQIVEIGDENSPQDAFSVRRPFMGSQPSLDLTCKTLHRRLSPDFRLFGNLGISLVATREGRAIVASTSRPFEELEERAALAIEGMDPLVPAMVTGVTTLGRKKGKSAKALALTFDDDAAKTILDDRARLLMPVDTEQVSDQEFTAHVSIGATRDSGVAAEAEAIAEALVPGQMFMFFGKAVFNAVHAQVDYQ
jgi:hypothetical protein